MLPEDRFGSAPETSLGHLSTLANGWYLEINRGARTCMQRLLLVVGGRASRTVVRSFDFTAYIICQGYVAPGDRRLGAWL